MKKIIEISKEMSPKKKYRNGPKLSNVKQGELPIPQIRTMVLCAFDLGNMEIVMEILFGMVKYRVSG